MGADGGTPVWGIEAGDGFVRAARVSRSPEGGYVLLDYREEETPAPGPEAVVSFLRRRKLRKHALVAAFHSPSAHFRTVELPPYDVERTERETATALAEYVHPESEDLEFRWTRTPTGSHLLVADSRARAESWLLALEHEELPACSLVSGLDALVAAARAGGLDGDAILVRVGKRWSDVLFFRGEEIRHLALPGGAPVLSAEGGEARFAEDLRRLVLYERERGDREGRDRLLVLGAGEDVEERLADALDMDRAAFAGGSLTSSRRASGGPDAIRRAPGAVGAAIAGASEPRRLDLSLRPLPEALPGPPRRGGFFLAAAGLVWVAVAIAFLGLAEERARLRSALESRAGAAGWIRPETVERLAALERRARLGLSFPDGVRGLLEVVPGEESAPYRTQDLRLTAGDRGGYLGRLVVRFPDAEEGAESPEVAAAVERARRAGAEPEIRADPDGVTLILRTATEEER